MATIIPEDLAELAAPDEETVSTEQDEAVPTRIATPVRVVIASSFVLRLAGALTAIMLSSFLKQELNAGTDLIGVLYALFYVTELGLSPVFGAISDLRGRRVVLVLGPVVGALALPIYPISAVLSVGLLSVMVLAVARLLEGVATAAKVPSALGYLADATQGEGKARAALRGRVMGMYEVTFLVGVVTGTVIGGGMWEVLHAWGFFIISAVYLVAAGMLFFYVPETLPTEARTVHAELKEATGAAPHPVRDLLVLRLRTYAELLREPALRSFVPAWLAVNAVVGLFGNLVQPIMIMPKNGVSHFPDQLLDGKFTSSQVGVLYGSFGLFFMVGIFVWSLLYARIRKSTVMLIATAGLFTTCISLYLINDQVLPVPQPLNAWMLTPLLAISLFMVSGFTPVALAYLAEISGARVAHRGAVMGLYSVFLGFGQLLGSGVGGYFVKLVDQGFNGLILGTFILGVIAFVAVLGLRRTRKI